MTDEQILDEILRKEGWPTYTNDPHDRGGPTKGGITLDTLSHWRGRRVSPVDVANLKEAEAREIYRERYIEGPRFALMEDDLLREQLIDCGVLHGPGRATRWLQEALGDVAVDGRIGELTLGSLRQKDPHQIGLRVAALRQEFLARLIADNYRARREGRTSQDQSRFAAGWSARAMEFVHREAARGAAVVVAILAFLVVALPAGAGELRLDVDLARLEQLAQQVVAVESPPVPSPTTTSPERPPRVTPSAWCSTEECDVGSAVALVRWQGHVWWFEGRWLSVDLLTGAATFGAGGSAQVLEEAGVRGRLGLGVTAPYTTDAATGGSSFALTVYGSLTLEGEGGS